MSHPDTGLHLEVESTEPAFQFYTGEGIDIPPLEREDGSVTEAMGARKVSTFLRDFFPFW